MIKYALILLLILLLMIGCASKPPEKTGTFNINQPHKETAEILYSLAKKCWPKDSSFMKSGIKIDLSEYGGGGSQISVYKYADNLVAPDSRYGAFMFVYIKAQGSASLVVTEEGDCGSSCYMDFSSDISRWLKNDNTCKS